MSTKKIVEQNINVEHLFDDILLLTEVPVLEMSEQKDEIDPKIIQLLLTPNDETWQGVLLGLDSDGVTYVCGTSGRWEPLIRPLNYDG